MPEQQQIPKQTGLVWVLGPPEGRDFAPPGWVEIDATTGQWWKKTTRVEINTGWVEFGAGGDITIKQVSDYVNNAINDIVVPTLVELRMVDMTGDDPPRMKRTLGRAVQFDAQGRFYGWDPDSLDADDDLSTIKPDGFADDDPGRWRELF